MRRTDQRVQQRGWRAGNPFSWAMRKFLRNGSGERGQSMVEFALVAPLLLLLVVGGVDFSRAFLVHNALTNSVREGARYGITRPPDPPGMRALAKAELTSSTVTIADSDIHVLWAPANPPGSGCSLVLETETLATYQANKACYPFVKVKPHQITEHL